LFTRHQDIFAIANSPTRVLAAYVRNNVVYISGLIFESPLLTSVMPSTYHTIFITQHHGLLDELKRIIFV